MKNVIKISGASDDLVEIDGDISEEFTYNDDEPHYLGFSDGTVLKIFYDETGLWKIVQINKGESDFDFEFIATNSDSDDYSDIAILKNAKIDWVIYGSKFAKNKNI